MINCEITAKVITIRNHFCICIMRTFLINNFPKWIMTNTLYILSRVVLVVNRLLGNKLSCYGRFFSKIMPRLQEKRPKCSTFVIYIVHSFKQDSAYTYANTQIHNQFSAYTYANAAIH